MIYTRDFIVEQQTIGPACPDCIYNDMHENYVLLTVPLSRIKIDGIENPNITRDIWLKKYGYGNDDADGIATITMLMERFKQEMEVYPIILDKNMDIMDGLHRYVAAKWLNLTTIEAYFPL